VADVQKAAANIAVIQVGDMVQHRRANHRRNLNLIPRVSVVRQRLNHVNQVVLRVTTVQPELMVLTLCGNVLNAEHVMRNINRAGKLNNIILLVRGVKRQQVNLKQKHLVYFTILSYL